MSDGERYERLFELNKRMLLVLAVVWLYVVAGARVWREPAHQGGRCHYQVCRA